MFSSSGNSVHARMMLIEAKRFFFTERHVIFNENPNGEG
jgi:hypothetical protein